MNSDSNNQYVDNNAIASSITLPKSAAGGNFLLVSSSSESLEKTMVSDKTLSASSSFETLKGTMQANSSSPKSSTDSLSVSTEKKTSSLYNPTRWGIIHASITCLLASFAGFLFGFDTGTISGFLGMDPFKERFGDLLADGTYAIPALRSGLIVSAVCIGGLVGGLSASQFCEKFGRIHSAMGYILIYIAAMVQMLFAKSWIHFFFARIMMGVAIGSYTLIIPMLISESSPNPSREFNVSLFQLMITLGILVGNLTVFKTHAYTSIAAYTHPIYVALGIATALFFIILKTPESPRYLLARKNFAKAKLSIARFMSTDPDSLYVAHEVEYLYEAVQKDKEAGNASWGELITGQPRILFRVFVGTGIQILQLFSGANYFFYYGTLLFSQVGGDMDKFATPIVLSGVNVACTLIGLVVVPRFSRRSMLITGALGMLVSFVVFAILGSFFFHPEITVDGVINQQSANVGKAMIGCACTFILFYASTWAPLSYVMSAELFPQRIRSKAMSLGFSSNWVLSILVNLFTPFIVKKIGFSIGFIFSGCLLAAVVFSFFCVHETKGLTLEQTDVMYASGISAIQSSKKTVREQILATTPKLEV